MSMTGKDLKELADEVRARCRFIREQLDDKALRLLMTGVMQEAQRTLGGIESRLTEVGAMPGDVASVLMVYGAVTAVLEDLPAETERRQLVEAGAAIGRFIAKRYAENITEKLNKRKERADA